MTGRQAGDGTCLSLWRRGCHLHYRCWSLPGYCLHFEKDLETGVENKEKRVVCEREKMVSFYDDI